MFQAFFLAHALFVSHGGFPPVATIINPVGTASISVTGSTAPYLLRWIDTNQPIVTGTATIDLYYVETNPPTYRLGTVPETLTGTAIQLGIRETDPTDSVELDLRNVPTGTYWFWSIVHEPANELGFQQIFYFSPGTLTVVHSGDEEPPAIYITSPDTPFPFGDESYEIKYDASDPHGTGRVKLEATLSRDGTGFTTIAENLPAVKNGSFLWNTKDLVHGDYTLRATIEDARGMSRSVYARYFLLIEHFPDAGVRPDAMTPEMNEDEDGGCSCSALERRASAERSLLLFSLLALLRAGSRASGPRRGTRAAK